jgi:predicted TPR repeat methyltransferase
MRTNTNVRNENNQSITNDDPFAEGPQTENDAARSVAQAEKEKELETDSDDEPIDTSDMTSLNDSEQAEQAAEAYVMQYDKKKDKEEINYDNYQFSVAQKYDLTTRRLTFKKVKYIADELFLDLKWRMRYTIQFQTSILFIVFLFFLRQLVHYLG